MNATAETFAQFESLNDLKNPPRNWEGAMEAVIAGAVDHDEIEPLCLACCDIADDAIGTSFGPSEPNWFDVLPPMLDQLEKAHRDESEPSEWCARQLRAMGKIADMQSAKEAGK